MNLREVACERMKNNNDQESLVYKLWLCSLLQYMVPLVHHSPELVHECDQNFNSDIDIIEGWNLRLVINFDSIRDMLCIPTRHIGEAPDKFTRNNLDNF